MLKNEGGITLIVLSLTVVVMFILLGVTFYLAFNEDEGVLEEVQTETQIQQNVVNNQKEEMNRVLQDIEKDWGIG